MRVKWNEDCLSNQAFWFFKICAKSLTNSLSWEGSENFQEFSYYISDSDSQGYTFFKRKNSMFWRFTIKMLAVYFSVFSTMGLWLEPHCPFFPKGYKDKVFIFSRYSFLISTFGCLCLYTRTLRTDFLGRQGEVMDTIITFWKLNVMTTAITSRRKQLLVFVPLLHYEMCLNKPSAVQWGYSSLLCMRYA